MASSNLSPATLNTKASQETFISLLQLDPQPMADDEDKPLPALPEEGSALSTSSSDSWTNVMADSAATVRPGDGDSASQQPPEPPAVPKVTANPLGLSRSPIYYRGSSIMCATGPEQGFLGAPPTDARPCFSRSMQSARYTCH